MTRSGASDVQSRTAVGAGPRILTPDQRPRVFISSTLAEMAPERLAARRAVETLRLIPVMFELGARPHPARALYRAYLAQSHVFVGLYAERYGWVAPGEDVSGLEDEYLLSGGLPKLVYIRTPAPQREERLKRLLDRIRDDDQVAYKSFSDADELERLLREDLAVLLGERFLLGHPEPDAELVGQLSAPEAPTVRPLPKPLTGLVGRKREVAEIERLIDDGARLITLVGPGGIGKTRVALEVAHRADAGHPGLSVFVPLDTVRDPVAVLPAIGAALGIGLDTTVPAVDALSRGLRDSVMLLVLDNMEQVLRSAAEITELLQRCPGVTAVVTSRAPLRVRGERQVAIGPLAMPNGDRGDLDRYAAVQLFLERAREVRPGLTLDDAQDADAVAELTKRLEGIPLALELAAARSGTLPPKALLSRVRSALDLGAGAADAPARQRTLRDTIAWSEELLPAEQRLLLAELSVFEGPWTLADAEAVAGDTTGDVLEAVGGLVEHSLVYPSPSALGEPRFRLYEAVRAYAAQRLDADQREAAEARFVDRMVAVIHELDAGFRSPDHARWRSEFRLLWPDLRRAMELALARGDAERAGHLTRAWVGLWMDGRADQIADLMQQALELADEVQPPDHGGVVLAAAGLAFNTGDEARARALIERYAHGLELPPEPELPGTVELYLGYLSAGTGDLAGAEEHLRRSSELLSSCGTGGGWIEAFTHNGLGSLYALRGDLPAAYAELHLSGELGRRYGNVAAEMQSSVFSAALRLQAGEVDEAARLLGIAAGIVERYPFYEANAYCVEIAGAVALARGDAAAAARALGAGAALREVVGARVWPLLAAVRAAIEQNVRTALPAETYEREFSQGLQIDLMTLAAVVRNLAGVTA